MNRNLISIFVCAIAAAGFQSAEAKTAGASISWMKAYPTASAKAKASGKLIMIDFYTGWCGWCKKLDAETYPDPAVVKESAKFIPIKLDAEKDPEGVRLAKKFKVNGYPTILFVDGDENLAYKVVGYEPAKDFAASMDKAATIRQDHKKYERELKANPKNVTALVGLAGIDATMGDFDGAAALVDRAMGAATPATKGALLDGYNAVGDGFQNAGQFDKAIGYFQDAIDPAFPKQTAYARVSLASCYLSTNQPAKAEPILRDLLGMGSAADSYRKDAQSMLDMIEKSAKPSK
jgi:thiol-disulfide isomerase/thioredoxin